MRPSRSTRLAAALAMCAVVGAPRSSPGAALDPFLREAVRRSRPSAPVRGDGIFTVTTPEGATTYAVVVVLDPQGRVYLEAARAGSLRLRLLVPPTGGTSWAVAGSHGRAEPRPVTDPLLGSPFALTDLRPLRRAWFHDPMIVDRSGGELTLSFAPPDDPYVLVVVTFGEADHVPRKTLYYEETVNNLVKMRTASDYVDVAGARLPRRATMEHFALNARAVFDLRWRPAGRLPTGLFDPGAFGAAPPLGAAGPSAPAL